MENNSVNVYLRIRPSQIWESSSPAKTYMDINSSTEKMIVIEKNPFVFDNVFYSASTQGEIFQRIVSIIIVYNQMNFPFYHLCVFYVYKN